LNIISLAGTALPTVVINTKDKKTEWVYFKISVWFSKCYSRHIYSRYNIS